MSRQRFTGQIAVITGAAHGIGRATAEQLSTEGAELLLLDRLAAQVGELADRLVADGGAATGYPVDLLDEPAVADLARRLTAAYPAVHVLVHCAGVVHINGRQDSTFIEGGLAGWNELFGVNLKGAALLTHGLLPALINGRGAVVNVASEAAYRTRPNKWIYDATKAGMVSFNRSLAASLAPHGVRVNCVAPGGTITEMHLNDHADPEAARDELRAMRIPNLLGRFAEPAEIASAITFLASSEASFVTGTTLAVDGGGQASR
ncbi:SDR family NAD(P)-dependent oxidoreductase [Microlunatus parietis]|uniref:NAD(P)-dependent dehydrogenase (Short-subunit alcohol dehydrogenase family) n=1 Tax=Microlunatus parietis TaxID=682979 RepID=A0A7Y9IBA4_9ACTN|nr:SDR family NAD(P)-dependent oxidoreductase [Microlunatus parietis]NYE73478.1 NAD(P)-dependent dehydrogenase (short-subunit alcohol dehydrogenase family) [Microlunatus parietis]